MSKKTRNRNKAYQKPKTVPIRQSQRMDATPVATETGKQKSLVQSNPKLSVMVMIVIDFLLYYLMIDEAETMSRSLIIIFTLLAPSTLFSFYVYDYQRGLYPADGTDTPKFVNNKLKYVTIGWFAFTIWGILLLILEPIVVPKLFEMLDRTYQESQILMMIFVAPIMEEIAFRYLLYDRWLKKKCGWFLGFVIASFIFVVCHPVSNVQGLIIYWVPTILFFLIYNEFGLYGAIMIHMLYNMFAI